MEVNSPVIRESAVDWITATASRADLAGQLASFGAYLCEKLVADGNVERLFDWRGYSLHRCASSAYGTRVDGTMLQLSGGLAASHYRTAIASSEHIARLDLQVTVQVNPDNVDLARAGYSTGLDQNIRASRPVTYTHYQNSTGGSTLYVGSRKSDMMGRLYNKWAESADQQYRGCWRYEVELKNDYATHFGMKLLAVQDKPALIAGLVWKWFEERGVMPVFNHDSPIDLRLPPAAPSDAEKMLTWLRIQVSPTVFKLRSIGLLDKVLHALDLPEQPRYGADPTDFAANGNHSGDLGGV